MDKNTFFGLLDRYQDGKATAAEVRLLEEYYRRLEAGGLLTELSPDEELVIKERMFRIIAAGMKGPVVRRIFSWKKIAVAASVILAIGIGTYFTFFNTFRQAQGDKQPITSNEIKDLPPGRDAAMLTLADGRKILLDSTTGTITDANGIQIINAKGLLSYQGDASASLSMTYNTITTARGNQYQLQLEDGTKVWLNSASSLRYPVAFMGNDRQVELTGEGYFEVAHNPAKPFKVKTDNQIVEVLGTHFNINSYSDEDAVRTTLLEGSVKVAFPNPSAGGALEEVFLKPGQQAVLIGGTLRQAQGVDLEKIMAWKNGWFEFDQLDLGAIMRQVSRWYDVDIEFEGKLTTEKFGGRISKNLPLSAVIEMMKANGVDCKLNGKTLSVKP